MTFLGVGVAYRRSTGAQRDTRAWNQRVILLIFTISASTTCPRPFVFKTFGFSQHPVKFSLKIELEYVLLKGNFCLGRVPVYTSKKYLRRYLYHSILLLNSPYSNEKSITYGRLHIPTLNIKICFLCVLAI